MAYTASSGFRFYRTLSGADKPHPIPLKIANSTTLRVGDLVRVNTAGFVVASGDTGALAGVLEGFVNKDGINPFSLGFSTASGATMTGDDTLATASDNQTATDDYIQALVTLDPSGDVLWLNDADSDLAQTNVFQYFDSTGSGRQVSVSSASDANGQLQLIFWDPQGTSNVPANPTTADASKGAFRIAENQFGLGLDSATAKVAA